MSVSRLLFVLALLFFSLNGLVSAAVNDWQTIITGKSETIEINKTSIERATTGATAWSRLLLDRPVSDVGDIYDTMQVQNFYDCAARRFTTLRRAYFRGDALVREDVVFRQRLNTIEVGSLDERIFNAACATIAHGPSTLRMTPDPVATPQAIPQARNENPDAENLMLVAEKGPVEKPKLIILSPIDKTAANKDAADQAAVSSVKKPPALLGRMSLVPKDSINPLQQEMKSRENKRLRELHYAASVPRRALKKKPAATFTVNSQGESPATKLGAWSYDGESEPAHWARLSDDSAICETGERQSPIDIREGIKVDPEKITFDYKPRPFRIVDTGHTVRVHVSEGLGLKVLGKRYELFYFDFHRPPEERVNGRTYDIVMHLAHKNDEGQLAVVAMLLEKGNENPLIQTLWNNLPLDRNIEVALADVIDLSKMLPESRTY